MLGVVEALKGPPALLGACLLLFIEEAGIPTPAPGEFILVGVGLLVAAGAVPWWVAVPAAYAAVAMGAGTAYAVARLLGLRRIRWVATHLGLEQVLDRATERLRGAQAREVAISRLIPGLRIMTTLVAGALEVEAGVFLRGMLSAGGAWVIGFVAIGFFVGVPAERLLGNFAAFGFRAVAILAVLAIGYFIIRRVPHRQRAEPKPPPRRPATGRRRVAAFAIDVMTIAGAVAILDALTGLELGNLNAPFTTTVVLTGLSVLYVVIARQSRGRTLGERLTDV